jgi:hypothetical protein
MVRRDSCLPCGFDALAYRALALLEACPSHSRMDTISAPGSSPLAAHLCRHLWPLATPPAALASRAMCF